MEALMKRIVAALLVAVVALNAAPALAETSDRKPEPVRKDGPLLKASLNPNLTAPSRAEARKTAPAAKQDDRSWVERHPVWTGAIAGFATGFSLTFLMTDEGGIPGPGGPALVWGGVGAGIGALMGWGIGRNRDDE
jgi:hypothetical protein